jgi:hypothetical protein
MTKATLYGPEGTVRYDKVSGVKMNGGCLEFHVDEGCIVDSKLPGGTDLRVKTDVGYDLKTNVQFVVEAKAGS